MRALRLRVSGQHVAELRASLFPGDGCEAVAIALCGRHSSDEYEHLCVHEVHAAPASAYRARRPGRASWTTEWVEPLLARAGDQRWAVLKVHSHPTGLPRFSQLDDDADRALFPSIHGWTQDVPFHASAIMLPDGMLVVRGAFEDGSFVAADRVVVAGDRITVSDAASTIEVTPPWAARHEQALGSATTALLQRLRVGVVGCSGTGSFVIEMLGRLGVGEIVLVDPDFVEEVNLNRIAFARRHDVGQPKVATAARYLRSLDLGTTGIPVHRDLAHAASVRALAACDVVFGCMDSHDGRRLLNKLATFYVLPYFDVGVRLDADGAGGIEHVSGAVHYLQPGRSSLLSRGVIDNDRATAEARQRTDPEGYRRLAQQRYLRGAAETRPAVISVNAMFAAMAVNDFLARLHGFRDDDAAHAEQRFIVHDPCYVPGGESRACDALAHHVGRGDTSPLLDMPELSSALECA